MKYSVLMSVYEKESPVFFRSAIESMILQTVKTDDFVLVCDGKLTKELDDIIQWAEKALHGSIRVIRLKENVGLGKALNEGLKACKNELVARMDSDDISLSDRCEKQLSAFYSNPEISIISGTVEEFTDNVDEVTVRRVLPETNEEILRFAQNRNPFNHPCVMFKKSAVERAGGYQDLYRLEDYYLWVRMLLKGEKGMNLREPLIRMRTGAGMYKRRGGVKYIRAQYRLFSYMKECGMITGRRFIKNMLIRTLSGLAPGSIRSLIYRKLLRK